MTKKIKLWLLDSLPMCVTWLLAVLYVIPKHVEGLSGVMPLVHLMPVFIWGVMHSRDISLFTLALLGLFVDVTTSLPLGLSALSYCLFLMLLWSQRKYIYREGFVAMWGYFALMLFFMQTVSWMLYSFFHEQAMAFDSALWQWLFSVLLYPLIHCVLYPWVEKLAVARYRLLHA